MAGALNEGLRARELISHITRSKDRRTLFVKGNHKKQSQSLSTLTTSASTNSFSRVMNKKWNRNSEKTRKAAGLAHTAIPPAARNSYDLVNELVDQFDALESCLISFGQHARSWSETACHNVRSCHRLVGAYLDLCRPIGTTHSEDESSFARILDFRHLLSTIESETSQMAIDSVETELLPPLEKLIYAFKSPRKVIEKRALRLIDLQYQQPKATQEPSCLDAGRDFVSLSERLLLELPHFLASIHRAFEAVLFSFAEIQQNHFGLLHRHLQAFSDLHLPAEASESGEYDAVSRYLFSHCRATGGTPFSYCRRTKPDHQA